MQPRCCRPPAGNIVGWRMIKNRLELTWVKSFWTELMVMITFWKTLLQMGHGCTGTMSKRKSNHHSGCQKRRRDQKSTPSAFKRQGDADGIFWFWGCCSLWVSTHKAGQSIRSIIWKLCNVFMRQSGKKDLMRGGRIDGYSNMTKRPHIHRSLSVTSWPNMRRLSFQSSNQRRKAAVLSL